MASQLLDLFRTAVDKQPDAPAFTFVGGRQEQYTYGELFARSEELAERLEERGLSPGAPLGLLLRTQEDQAVHYVAALAAGLVPAILTPPNPKLNRDYYLETMAGVLARSGFSALITDVDGLAVPITTLTPYEFRLGGERPSGEESRRPDAAFLQFSSGTTGIKRGVLVTHEAAISQIVEYGRSIGLHERDVILSWLPLYHDMGFIACLNMPLAYGTHTVMIDPIAWVTTPSLFVRAASKHRATLAWNPNFAYAFMAQRVPSADLVGLDLSSFRGLANCSEPVTHESQKKFLERFRSVGLSENVFWGCYAMAETTFALTHGTSADPDYLDPVGPERTPLRAKPVVSVGRPLASVELRVVSEEGKELPDRRVGELYARSPFTFSGYYNDPESTADAFQDGWYRTGDVGYRIGDAFYVIERKKDVMIVGGVNVLPQDVEWLTSAVEGVIPGRVCAFSDFDPRVETERIFVIFESELDDHRAQSALVLDVRQHILAAFQIANFEVHMVEPGWLVKSSAGKISRRMSRSKWQARSRTSAETQASND